MVILWYWDDITHDNYRITMDTRWMNTGGQWVNPAFLRREHLREIPSALTVPNLINMEGHSNIEMEVS